MTNDPDTHKTIVDIIQKVVGEPIKIKSSQAAGIEMEKTRIGTRLFDSNMELCEKVLFKLIGNGRIRR